MSSHYTPGDVSADVEALVRRLLKKYPTLAFTSSSVAAELKYDEKDVRRALFLESERGLLEPFITWRCEECDSPSVYALSDTSPVSICHTCEEDRKFDQYLYFKATATRMRRLKDDEKDQGGVHPKKADAANEESVDRIATASLSPQKSDVPTQNDRDFMERIAAGIERTAAATEQTANSTAATAVSTAATAVSTATSANDRTPKWTLFWTIVGVAVMLAVGWFGWWAPEYHLYARLTRTGEYAPTPTPSPSAKSSNAQKTRPK